MTSARAGLSASTLSIRATKSQIQANCPLRRVEVLEEIVDVCDPGERGTNFLDATERGLRFSFAVLDDAVDHAGERLDEFRPDHLEEVPRCRIGATGVMRAATISTNRRIGGDAAR